MDGIVAQEIACAKERLYELFRLTLDAELRTRCLIMVHRLEGRSPTWIVEALKVSRSNVYRTQERYLKEGEAGLFDHRVGNGERKLTEEFLEQLHEVVASDPQQHGWTRPTWTRELLVKTLRKLTGTKVALSTMSQALRQIGARRGRPKPTVACPWPEAEKQRRLAEIDAMIAQLPKDEVAVYEDEVDIHLNPKIGLDWMVQGQQKEVLTPGQNEKRYLAGAKDVRAGELITVEGDRKDSVLFIMLLWALVQRYPRAKKIHVILDNYCIHSTKLVQACLDSAEGHRLEFHFLPPYCPDHNKIERSWQDLHANVTRNHKCPTMGMLMSNVRNYLRRHNKSRTTTVC